MVRSSSSLPLRRTMSTAVMIMPGVQKPHCRPWFSRNASCIGCNGPSWAASPSMVSTLAPSSCSAKTVQDLIALPLTCTTQAPHCDVSQPTCVPVSRKCSRKSCTSSVRGSTLAVMGLPFTVMDTAAVSPAIGSLLEMRSKTLRFASQARSPAGFGREIEPILAVLTPRTPFTVNRRTVAGQAGPTPPQLSKRRIAAQIGAHPTARRLCRLRVHRIGKIREKIVGDFFGRAIDQTLTELRQLAANLGVDVVGQKRAAIFRRELDGSAALGKAGNPAITLSGNLITVGRIKIGQRDPAFELCFDRSDLDRSDRLKLGIRRFVELLAAGNARFQRRRIV